MLQGWASTPSGPHPFLPTPTAYCKSSSSRMCRSAEASSLQLRLPLCVKDTHLSVPGTVTSTSRELMTSLASEHSFCGGRKEGFLQPSSWGLSDCGVKRHRHLRQLWQPGPFQVSKCYSEEVGDNGSPHCWMLTVHQGLDQAFCSP